MNKKEMKDKVEKKTMVIVKVIKALRKQKQKQ